MLKLEEDRIDSFSGPFRRFSNFYPVMIRFRALVFPSVEHAYVASKSKSRLFWLEIASLEPEHAGRAKRLGRKTRLREDWDMVKLAFMRDFLRQKFNYPQFKELLLSTGELPIIEGNRWHDNYWGECSCDKCRNVEGQNRLGKMLMEIRGELLNENSDNRGRS